MRILSQYHSSTMTLSNQRLRHWMCYRKVLLTIIEMLMTLETYRNRSRGPVRFNQKNLQTETRGLGVTDKNSSKKQGPIINDQIFVQVYWKLLQAVEKCKNPKVDKYSCFARFITLGTEKLVTKITSILVDQNKYVSRRLTESVTLCHLRFSGFWVFQLTLSRKRKWTTVTHHVHHEIRYIAGSLWLQNDSSNCWATRKFISMSQVLKITNTNIGVKRSDKSSKNTDMTNDESQEQRKRSSKRYRKKKGRFFIRWLSSVISKTLSWNRNYKITVDVLYSGVTLWNTNQTFTLCLRSMILQYLVSQS